MGIIEHSQLMRMWCQLAMAAGTVAANKTSQRGAADLRQLPHRHSRVWGHLLKQTG